MPKKYKVWVHIEEQDEADDHYEDVYEPMAVDQDFHSLYEAVECAETLVAVGASL